MSIEEMLSSKEEVSKSINEANVHEVRNRVKSMSREEKEEAIKCFPDDLVINQFLSKFKDYKNFAIQIVDCVEDLKSKVGVDE